MLVSIYQTFKMYTIRYNDIKVVSSCNKCNCETNVKSDAYQQLLILTINWLIFSFYLLFSRMIGLCLTKTS